MTDLKVASYLGRPTNDAASNGTPAVSKEEDNKKPQQYARQVWKREWEVVDWILVVRWFVGVVVSLKKIHFLTGCVGCVGGWWGILLVVTATSRIRRRRRCCVSGEAITEEGLGLCGTAQTQLAR